MKVLRPKSSLFPHCSHILGTKYPQRSVPKRPVVTPIPQLRRPPVTFAQNEPQLQFSIAPARNEHVSSCTCARRSSANDSLNGVLDVGAVEPSAMHTDGNRAFKRTTGRGDGPLLPLRRFEATSTARLAQNILCRRQEPNNPVNVPNSIRHTVRQHPLIINVP
jgi:hypothetical protein